MTEIELKFQIPAAALPAVRAALAQAAAQGDDPGPHTLMQAAYFDTPGHALAGRRCALRVRRENDAVVQTFKGAGADAMTRLEENRPLPALGPQASLPSPDLSLHSPAVREALAECLREAWRPTLDGSGAQAGLRPLHETRFLRQHARLRRPLGRVLLCLDEGCIVAGSLQQPLAELELELADGSPRAVIDAAREWVSHFGLWLDVQSKAQKGTRLAVQATLTEGPAHGPARAEPVTGPTGWESDLRRAHTPPALRASLSTVLDVCAGNWAEVAQGKNQADACLRAWLGALQALQQARTDLPRLGPRFPASFWQRTAQTTRDLQALCQPGGGGEAAAWSRHPDHSLWALDLLDALHTPVG